MSICYSNGIQLHCLGTESNTRLAGYTAGLLQEGVLQRGLAKALTAATNKALGRKLPIKCRRIRKLPTNFKKQFLVESSETMRATLSRMEEMKANDEEPREILSNASDENINNAVAWALMLDPNAELPCGFSGIQYEGMKGLLHPSPALTRNRNKPLNNIKHKRRENSLILFWVGWGGGKGGNGGRRP